jgi:hypothetical protein
MNVAVGSYFLLRLLVGPLRRSREWLVREEEPLPLQRFECQSGGGAG